MTTQAPATLSISSLTASAYRVPNAKRETDGTLGWSATGVVVVQINAGGHEGLGNSYTDPLMARLVVETLKPLLLGAGAWSVEGLFDRLQAQVRNLGRSGLEGLAAIDAEAMTRYGVAFHDLSLEQQHSLITAMEQDAVTSPHWDHLPSKLLFRSRLMHDLIVAYYSHPAAWSDISFGGPGQSTRLRAPRAGSTGPLGAR